MQKKLTEKGETDFPLKLSVPDNLTHFPPMSACQSNSGHWGCHGFLAALLTSPSVRGWGGRLPDYCILARRGATATAGSTDQ